MKTAIYNRMDLQEKSTYCSELPKFRVYSDDDEFKKDSKILLKDILTYERCEDENLIEGKFYIFRKDNVEMLRRIVRHPDHIKLESEKEDMSFCFPTEEVIFEFWDEVNIVRSFTRHFF